MSHTARWLPPWHPDRRTGRFTGDAVGVPPAWHGDGRTRRFTPDAGVRLRPPYGFPLPAVVFAGLLQVLAARSAAAHGDVFRAMDALSYALLLTGPAALLWRRRAPVTVFLVAAAASTVFACHATPRWMYAVAPAIALFGIARAGRSRAAVAAAAVAYLGYLLPGVAFAGRLGLPAGARPDVGDALVLAVGLALMIFLGSAAKARSEQMAEMIKVRAERARARQEQERRQASEERLRIARELHDVLGHHLSLINVQAGVGLHLMDNRPEQAREALTAIKTASAEALREVRAVLGVLRTDDEAAPRQPALGISRLNDLTADAGLPVSTAVTGPARELPPEVDRAAYRIVQEALTNVRKHAGPAATATVSVDYLPTALHLAIRNDGRPGTPSGHPDTPRADPGSPRAESDLAGTGAPGAMPGAPGAMPGTPGGDGSGTGIAGMRERAQSLGGTLEAGPVEGGYLVSVLLPADFRGREGDA